MLKALSVAILGAGVMAFATLPAQAFEVGVVIKPQIVVGHEHPRRVVVVEKERHHYRPVVEKRVVVVEKHPHWKRGHREVVVVDRRNDSWRHPYGGMERGREVVVVRR